MWRSWCDIKGWRAGLSSHVTSTGTAARGHVLVPNYSIINTCCFIKQQVHELFTAFLPQCSEMCQKQLLLLGFNMMFYYALMFSSPISFWCPVPNFIKWSYIYEAVLESSVHDIIIACSDVAHQGFCFFVCVFLQSWTAYPVGWSPGMWRTGPHTGWRVLQWSLPEPCREKKHM